MIASEQRKPPVAASSLPRSAVLALIAITLALHNGEEYFTFPLFFRSLGRQLPGWLPAPALQHSATNLHIALILATVLPGAFIVWSIFSRRQWLLIAALLVEAVLLVNALAHSLAALLRGGYVPGLITAVLINLPFGLYVFRRAVKERWIRSSVAWQLIGVAIVLHVVWLSSGIVVSRYSAACDGPIIGRSDEDFGGRLQDLHREANLQAIDLRA